MEIPELRDWAMVADTSSYLAPERRVPRLHGKVYNSPDHKNGTAITTSQLLGKVTEEVVKTRNSLYKLGEPFDGYAENFPDAKARLFSTLPQL